jgi:hypothetical protein
MKVAVLVELLLIASTLVKTSIVTFLVDVRLSGGHGSSSAIMAIFRLVFSCTQLFVAGGSTGWAAAGRAAVD